MEIVINVCSFDYTYSPYLFHVVSDGVNTLYFYAVWCTSV